MNLKLLAFAALVICGTAASGMQEFSMRRSVSPAAASVVLVPETIGPLRIAQRWNNPQRDGAVEQGALYNAASGVALQLDFFRNRAYMHNGIGCYLMEGESLAWERPRTLRMASADAQFDLALLSTGDGLRLVAATECTAEKCVERTLWGQAVAGSQLRWDGATRRLQSVVPVSIVLSSPLNGEEPAVVEARLMSQLQDAAGLIDLAPAQKLAALQ